MALPGPDAGAAPMAAFQSGRKDRSAAFQEGKKAARAGVHQTGIPPAAPSAGGSSLLRSGPVSSALPLKTQKRSTRTDRSRITTGRQPDKTRRQLGRRQSKGPPRQQYRFATDVNLWQIGFGRIRCRCLISHNTFSCNMFSWSRLGEPSLRSSPPRTYALRVDDDSPSNRLP